MEAAIARQRGRQVLVVPGWHNKLAAVADAHAAGGLVARRSMRARRGSGYRPGGRGRIEPRTSTSSSSARAPAAATLAQRLAPTGKSILILERGEHLPREAENWDPKAVFLDQRYRTKEHWYDQRGKPFIPNTHYWVGGNTTFYGAALMRLRKRRLRGGAARRRRLAGLADLADRPGALLRRGGDAVAGARRAGRRPDRGRRRAALRLSGAEATIPASRGCKTHLESAGLEALPPAAGRRLRRRPPGDLALHPLQDLRRLSLPGEGQVRRPHPAPSSRMLDLPNVTLLTGRKVTRLETDAARQDGHGGGLRDRARRGALERRHRGAGRRRGEHAR